MMRICDTGLFELGVAGEVFRKKNGFLDNLK
jgi:hypothetical protein